MHTNLDFLQFYRMTFESTSFVCENFYILYNPICPFLVLSWAVIVLLRKFLHCWNRTMLTSCSALCFAFKQKESFVGGVVKAICKRFELLEKPAD